MGDEVRFRAGLLGALGASTSVDDEGIHEHWGPWRRSIGWSDVADVRVARPAGLRPGVTVVVTRTDGSETALMTLVLDVLPSSAGSHERLRQAAATMTAMRPVGG